MKQSGKLIHKKSLLVSLEIMGKKVIKGGGKIGKRHSRTIHQLTVKETLWIGKLRLMPRHFSLSMNVLLHFTLMSSSSLDLVFKRDC